MAVMDRNEVTKMIVAAKVRKGIKSVDQRTSEHHGPGELR